MEHRLHSKISIWKRCFDVIAASTALILLSPLLIAVAVCVRLFLGSPVVFRQERPGLRGRPFTLYKFRTMRECCACSVCSDVERITRFGNLLRRTSLDELPELWNVIRGEMSLVGPRPLLMQYLDRYTPQQWRRHEVLPGITGWAQVNGRNSSSWNTRFAFDVWYIDHQSFWLDLRILGMTFVQVLKRDGISYSDHATMPEFMGEIRASLPWREDAACRVSTNN